MSEPPRLLDESESAFEKALLSAGSAYSASPELRVKTLAALGVAGAAALSAGAAGSATLSAAPPATAAGGSLLAKLGWLKAVGAFVTLGAAVGVPAVYLSQQSEVERPAAVGVRAAAPAAPAAAAEERAPAAPGAAAEERAPAGAARAADAVAAESAPAAAPAPSPGSGPAAKGSVKALSSSEALRVELSALDAARGRLAAGNPNAALALLDAYERSSPRGLLRLEAEVVRIEALSRSGRGELAKKRAQAFLARHPNSVLASRVRRLAGQ